MDKTNGSNLTNDNKEDALGKFVLENFPIYSGTTSVGDWLDAIEDKFIELKLGRKQRFTICLSIIKGQAKQKYIKKTVIRFIHMMIFTRFCYQNSNIRIKNTNNYYNG